MHIQLNYFIKVISHIRILVALSIHNVVQPPPISNSKPFSLPQNKIPYPLRSYSPFFPLPVLEIINLLYVSVDLSILYISYK